MDRIYIFYRSTSHVDLKEIVEGHSTDLSSKETTKSKLKSVHMDICNAKRVYNGIYRRISLLFNWLALAMAKIY
jgi:hypothetical protein